MMEQGEWESQRGPHEVTAGRHLDGDRPSFLKMFNRGQTVHPQDAVCVWGGGAGRGRDSAPSGGFGLMTLEVLPKPRSKILGLYEDL